MSIIKSFGTILRNFPIAEEQSKQFLSASVEVIPPLPKEFDGRIVWEKYLSPIRNQGSCGDCYAHASVGSLSDRYALLTLGSVKVKLSASDMTICMLNDPKMTASFQQVKRFYEDYIKEEKKAHEDIGCFGNTLYNAGKYLYIEGAPTEECIPDSLVTGVKNPSDTPSCEVVEGKDLDLCADGKTAQRYFRAIRTYQIDYMDPTSNVIEKNIMYDIYRWGPIAAGFIVFDDFLNDYKGNDIYTHPKTGASSQNKLGHAIRIVGWGEEIQNGINIPYWIIANSWGTKWGKGGYFKMQRNLPECDLEKNTLSVIPDLPGLFTTELHINSLITDEDRDLRNFLGVSLYSLYPTSAITKIQNGTADGDLSHIIVNPKNLPNFDKFLAGDIKHEGKEWASFKIIKYILFFIISCLIGFLIAKYFK